MPKVAILIVAASLALMALASLWLAGEMHYRNCLAKNEASAKYGVDYGTVFGGGSSTPGASCSRLPF